MSQDTPEAVAPPAPDWFAHAAAVDAAELARPDSDFDTLRNWPVVDLGDVNDLRTAMWNAEQRRAGFGARTIGIIIGKLRAAPAGLDINMDAMPPRWWVRAASDIPLDVYVPSPVDLIGMTDAECGPALLAIRDLARKHTSELGWTLPAEAEDEAHAPKPAAQPEDMRAMMRDAVASQRWGEADDEAVPGRPPAEPTWRCLSAGAESDFARAMRQLAPPSVITAAPTPPAPEPAPPPPPVITTEAPKAARKRPGPAKRRAPEVREDVHAVLRELREHLGSAERAADALGVTKRTLYRWLAGTHIPTEAQYDRARKLRDRERFASFRRTRPLPAAEGLGHQIDGALNGRREES